MEVCGCEDAVKVFLNHLGPEPAEHPTHNTHTPPPQQNPLVQAAALISTAPGDLRCLDLPGNTGLLSEQPVKLNMLILLAFLLLSYGAGNIHCSTVHVNITDILSLLDFKKATDDPTGALRSWNKSVHLCNWNGVTCSSINPGRVAALQLPGQRLAGQLTSSLGNMTFLERLDLSSNGFFGQIPPLNQLHEMQLLDLSSNSLQGIIPDSLTNCSNLQVLGLSRNMLEGPIPAKIGSLYNLGGLDLSRNNLNGVIPPTLSNSTQLTLLILQQNQLGGSIPDELGELTSMTGLGLGENRLSGRIPSSIFNLTSLTTLELYLNRLEMGLPLDIGDTLPNLRSLKLGANMLEGHIPASLGNASGLNMIDLSANSFDGEIPTFGKLLNLTYLILGSNKLESKDSQSWESLYGLTNCSSLTVLTLNKNRLQGVIPNSIGSLSTALARLQMGRNNLSGIVPPSLGNLGGLIDLELSNNSFTGTIEEWVGNLKKLQSLNLQGNNFVGSIPPSFGNLTRLTRLSLANNEFEGHIPPEIGEPKQLTTLDLSSNRLTGEISDNLGQCQGLVTIQMDHNNLTGNIPTFLGDLKNLNTLILSHNNLSGTIPVNLNKLQLLKLDLSYNHLQGAIPREGVFENATVVSLDGNLGLCGGASDLQMPPCPVGSRKNKAQYYLIRILIPIFGFMSLILLVYLLLLLRKMSRRTYLSQSPFGEQFLKVSYNDLAQATWNFSESNLVGKGSYGSVYKGKLKQDKVEVAVKVFDLEMRGAERSFMSECEALRSIQHRNLLSIITACSSVDNNGNPFRALIYEFMPKGNLDTWLHHKGGDEARKSLNLTQRISIAVNMADALDYLHNDCENAIIHCDVKPSNILLDDDMVAHLGDFGIARFYLDPRPTPAGTISSIGLKGTIGYIAPEYAGGGHLSTSGDVYSFGIVLLEMLTGRRPTDTIFKDGLDIVNFVGDNFPHQMAHVIDARLKEECKEFVEARMVSEDPVYQSLVSMLQVALSCTRPIPSERANMRETASKMQAIKASYLGSKAKKNS